MYCFVKPICYWNEEQWQQVKVSGSLVFAGAIWEKFAISLLHLGNGPISSKQGHSGSCASILPRALLVTAAAPALERVQCGNVHVLVSWSFTLHLLQDNRDPFRSYSYLFSCSKTSSKGNVPSQSESKATEHIGPDPMEYLHFYWCLNPPKLCI